MARIELRDAIVRFKDGFGGSGLVDDTAIAGGNDSLSIDTLTGLTNSVTLVPVGARFTINTVADTVFTVTESTANEIQRLTIDATSGNFTLDFDGEETANILFNANAAAIQAALVALSNIGPSDVVVTLVSGSIFDIEFTGVYEGLDVALIIATDVDLSGGGDTVGVVLREPAASTNYIEFTPVLDGGDLPANNDTITFLPQQIEIKVGDGDVTYTESNEYNYDLDRGDLDTVREGNQVPMDVALDIVYEHITTGTSETVSPMDALKKKGGASGWFSSASDQCEPYAIDVEIEHASPCGTSQDEITVFPDFRSESREVSFSDAVISVSGRCNAVEPIVTRV